MVGIHPIMKPSKFSQTSVFTRLTTCGFAVLAMATATAAPRLVITEINSNAAGGDFWELTNTGDMPQDMSLWKWDDDSANPQDAAAVTIPAGTTIAPGESIVFTTALDGTAFRTAWNLDAAVQVIVSPTGPGFGQNDQVHLFDASGSGITSLSYAVGGFTRNDGTPSIGGHAGASAGGAATSSLVLDPFHGAAAGRRYMAATQGVAAAYVNSSGGLNIGSPGRSGLLGFNLSNYVRVGRYNLPEPTRTTLPQGTPTHNYLAQEASAVTYNWDTDTLFITGDGGRAITQVSKSGALIDTMTLAVGSSPQGTDFYDPEGLTYIGSGQFVMSEERDRQLVRFTYAAGTTLGRNSQGVSTVKIGTFVDNTGTEGLSWDPLTNGFICLKEMTPMGLFQTTVDFVAGTASNGSATTVNSTDLFDPALLGMADVADVFALSNLPATAGTVHEDRLIVLGQEDARIVSVDRSGVIHSTLNISSDAGNPLTPAGQQHEGVTMDRSGILYVVNENGGGSIDYPQLWVYAPATQPNQAPTAVIVDNATSTLPETSSTASRVKIGDIVVTDDGLGTNSISLSGADAASFELSGTEFFLKAGVTLDFETKSSYVVTLHVDDSTVGATPDVSVNFTLNIGDVEPEAPPAPVIIISEVAPWASSNSAVAADWFEITNVTSSPINISGWKIDDSSASFASAAALNGVTSLAPGESAIFIETADLPGKSALFLSNWFGANPPAGLQIGSYNGSGLGLSTSSDGVNIYNAAGTLMASVSFGASDALAPFQTFDNTRGLNATTISQLSLAGTNGAIASGNAAEVGSPGFAAPGVLRITEVAAWGSGNGNYLADWFEVTNTGARAVDISGWKMDDSSESPAAALSLTGVASIAPGESVIFLETATPATTIATFRSTWFGANPPPALQIGSYTGSGAGLSTGGDAVVLYDINNVRQAKVFFGASPSASPFATFDNAGGADNVNLSTLSVAGANGAFVAATDADELGSPGTTFSAAQNDTTIVISDASISEGNSGSSTLSFTVTRSDRNGAFKVDYATSNATAMAGSDYAAASGTLTFTAGGSMTQSVHVSITGDISVEANETFIVTLSNVVNTAGTAALTDASGTGTITNDDTTPVAFPASNSFTSTVKGSIALAGAEIPAFDPISDRAFASSGAGIQVVSLTNPAAPVYISTITPSTLGIPGVTSDDISSVAVRKGSVGSPSVLAAAIINNPKTSAGHVVFLNAATGALISHVAVGVVPDHIAFTPDGSKLLVCNEGELSTPEVTVQLAVPDAAQGTVSIIGVDAAGVAGTVQTADFTAFDAQTSALKAAGVRIYDDGLPSTDFEPEYLAISPDGMKAMVTLQEANAVAVLDIATATFTSVAPLGKKAFRELRADFSDADGMKNPRTGQPVYGLYMPDAIASFSSAGQTYYVTANEGDDRNDFIAPNETTTVNNTGYDLDNTVFPNEAELKLNANLGKLTVSNLPGLRGDTDNDGDIDEILMYGARSFSILDATGAIIFDSGDMIEMIVASLHSAKFDDGRSDNKGPEPEGVAVATLGGRTLAFVGLERSHLTLVFDVSNPLAPNYVTSLVRDGDLNPEGIAVVSESDSPSGRPLVLVTNESSNTLSVFELTPATAFTLQLLHFADAEAGLLASQTAPNLAALVDAFDGTHANTLILAGGDNYLPGPFAAAGTDALVSATHNKGNNPFAADIEIHNRIGVEASTVGNHEFDFGTNAFADAVMDAEFPYLTANLVFSGDSGISSRYLETVGVGGLEEASSLKQRIVPNCVVTKGTEKIGLVGATTQLLRAITSAGNVQIKGNPAGDNMALLAAQLQPVIDDLKDQGVNKIILMAHLQQIANELILAPLLRDVDVILAAGSNTRLGDSDDVAATFPGHGANFAGNYPIYTAGSDGRPCVVVNTDNEFTYLGRLVLDFDSEGLIIVPNLQAKTSTNGAYAAIAENVAAAWGVTVGDLPGTAFAPGTKGSRVKQITDAVQGVINAKDGQVLGYTTVYLEGERSFVRNQETNLGNLSADSMLAAARRSLSGAGYVVALKNGGGIRAAIGAADSVTGAKLPPLANPAAGKPSGAVSLLDVENSMRFNNGLMLGQTTPAGLKALLEHGVAVLGGQGRFPQVGGVSFSYDPTRIAGDRIRRVALLDADGRFLTLIVDAGQVLPGAPEQITVVTLNFLANNGDGYPFKANADAFQYLLAGDNLSPAVDESLNFTAAGVVPANLLGEQLALASHLLARHATPENAYALADTPAADDKRIQSLAARADTVGARILFDSTVYRVGQFDTHVDLLVRRTGSSLPVEVTLHTDNGTAGVSPPFEPALAGTHYDDLNGQDTLLAFESGEMEKMVRVQLRPQSGSRQPNRRFVARLAEPGAGHLLGDASAASIEILAGDDLAPKVVVLSPAAEKLASTAEYPLQVSGRAGDARGIDRVEVALNGGSPVRAILAPSESPAAVPFSLAIQPLSGTNVLQVTAYDLSGNSSEVQLSFTYERRRSLVLSRTVPNAVAQTPSTAGSVSMRASPSAKATALSPASADANPKIAGILPGTSVSLSVRQESGYVFSHWSGLPQGAVQRGSSASFTMPDADLSVNAVFVSNPFAGLLTDSLFAGLIRPAQGVASSTATEGLLTGKLTTSRGSFSGSLLISGTTHRFSAVFLGDGSCWFNRSGDVLEEWLLPDGRALTLSIQGGVITANLQGNGLASSGEILPVPYGSANRVPSALLNSSDLGYYTVALLSKPQSPERDPSTYPQGDGHLTLNLKSSGVISWSGKLADGSSITGGGHLVQGDRTPFFVQLVTPGQASTVKGGLVTGSLDFDTRPADSDLSGMNLLWIRPGVTELGSPPASVAAAQATRAYTAGWSEGIEIDALGALYRASVDLQTALFLDPPAPSNGNANLRFAAGKLPAEVVQSSFNISGNTVTKNDPLNRSYSLKFSSSTGVFTGDFQPTWSPLNRRAPSFSGVVLQKGFNRGGYGYFMSNLPSDNDPESGRVTLERRDEGVSEGPFSYLVPLTEPVRGGQLGGVLVQNYGMVGTGRLSGNSVDQFGETMGAASGLFITNWSYESSSRQFTGRFQVLPDRGYNSGAIYSNYAARLHEVAFTFAPHYGPGPAMQPQIEPAYLGSTRFTYNDGGVTKVTTGLNPTGTSGVFGQPAGTVAAFNAPTQTVENLLSFDAEAVHLFADGSGYVSDEYGTYIARFNTAREITGITQLTDAAKPHKPAGVLNFDSIAPPANGRRNNQGLEGMSVSPDGTRLFALMQSALVQDTGPGQQGRFNTRLWVYDVSGANREAPVLVGEYAVQLPRYDLNGNASGLDVTAAQSEIVAISNTQFLMLPRDGNGLGKGTVDPIVIKSVDLVDFAAASNLMGLHAGEGAQISPAGVLLGSVTPARSIRVINLISSSDLAKFGFNVNTSSPDAFTVPEKMEGMAMVPDLSTSDPYDFFLFVANDNDFQSSDVKMVDAAGNLVSYGDARSSVNGSPPMTNDAVFMAWRIRIQPLP